MIHYPAALYFFVSKKKPDLAIAIEKGLTVAIQDGSMEKLFIEHFAGYIRDAKLHTRRVLQLHNPLLTKESTELPSTFWFDVKSGY